MTAKTIAYQGEPGANSHIACLDDYPDHQPLACATFEDAFVTLQDGGADLAMIPIENSIAGRVADIHALLPASGLHIIAETFLPIRFQLLAAPGATLETLRTVHSHVHALGQCRKIIRKLGLTPIVSSDTAGSAREVAEARDVTRASLATKLAGEIYGLTTLAADVEDEAHNTTRFVVLSKTPHWAAAAQRAGGDDVRLSGAQRAGGALQGARRLRHQRRQHDQARKLHDQRRVHGDAVPRRRRRPPGRPAAQARARGAGVLLGAKFACSASTPPTRSASRRSKRAE